MCISSLSHLGNSRTQKGGNSQQGRPSPHLSTLSHRRHETSIVIPFPSSVLPSNPPFCPPLHLDELRQGCPSTLHRSRTSNTSTTHRTAQRAGDYVRTELIPQRYLMHMEALQSPSSYIHTSGSCLCMHGDGYACTGSTGWLGLMGRGCASIPSYPTDLPHLLSAAFHQPYQHPSFLTLPSIHLEDSSTISI